MLLRPYNAAIENFYWVKEHEFNSGMEILLWPFGGLLIGGGWALWSKTRPVRARWWSDAGVMAGILALNTLLFDGFRMPEGFLDHDMLIDIAVWFGASITSLLAFSILWFRLRAVDLQG